MEVTLTRLKPLWIPPYVSTWKTTPKSNAFWNDRLDPFLGLFQLFFKTFLNACKHVTVRIHKSYFAKAYTAATKRTTESIHKVTARITSTDLPDIPSPATESEILVFHRPIKIFTFLTGWNQGVMRDFSLCTTHLLCPYKCCLGKKNVTKAETIYVKAPKHCCSM